MPTAALHGLIVAQVAGPPGLTAWGPDITTPAVVLATAGVARFLSSWHAGESLQGQIVSNIISCALSSFNRRHRTLLPLAHSRKPFSP